VSNKPEAALDTGFRPVLRVHSSGNRTGREEISERLHAGLHHGPQALIFDSTLGWLWSVLSPLLLSPFGLPFGLLLVLRLFFLLLYGSLERNELVAKAMLFGAQQPGQRQPH
jgi:hypothetical protein